MAENVNTSVRSGNPYPLPDVPRLSLAERDRRWSSVRELMRRDGLDAIIALHHGGSWDQGNGNGRYLSSIGGNCAWVSVVFPADGDVTAVVGPVPTPDFWLAFQDWVVDIRAAFFDSMSQIVGRLRELRLDRGCIGIAGLSGVARQPDGLVSVGAYNTLVAELPGARFVNATDLLYEARFVKSPEEIAMLEHGVGLVENALDVLDREASPGSLETVVYGRMMSSLVEAGSEPNTLLLWAAGRPLPPAPSMLPSRRPLGDDDVILVELDARWCGYLAHGSTTAWVGQPNDVERELLAVQHEAFTRCLTALRPGALLSELVSVCEEVASETPFVCTPIVHSRGLGFDAPVLVTRPRDEQTEKWVVREGASFALKPMVCTRDERHKVIWGDSVVITATGARRLGSRPPAGEKVLLLER